jgi:hypothetical protein
MFIDGYLDECGNCWRVLVAFFFVFALFAKLLCMTPPWPRFGVGVGIWLLEAGQFFIGPPFSRHPRTLPWIGEGNRFFFFGCSSFAPVFAVWTLISAGMSALASNFGRWVLVVVRQAVCVAI